MLSGEGKMEKGYVKTYNWVKDLLKNCDLTESSKRLGLQQIEGNAALLNFLDRTYRITNEGIELVAEKTMWKPDFEGYEYDVKSVLGYYVLSEANVEPTYEYAGLGQFSGGVFRESSSWMSMLNKMFFDTFGSGCEVFKKVMDMLGMEYEEGNRDGKYVWNYTILPKAPIKILFYEGDDEFPSKMQILYDKNIIKIFNFEQLSALHVSIFLALLSAAKENKTD
jgi:hypothetical protein